MLSLSTSEPTVSATRRLLGLCGSDHRLIDALDQIVALLIETIDVALGRRHRMIVGDACLVLFMPQLDVHTAKMGNQRTNGIVHHPIPGVQGFSSYGSHS